VEEIAMHFEPLLILLLLVILVPYLLGPIKVRNDVTISADPKILPFPPEDPSLPAEVAGYFHNVSESLHPLGFDVATGLAVPSATPQVKLVVLVFANRKEKIFSYTAAFFVGKHLKATELLFSTRWTDGTVVMTQNCPTLGVFGPRPGFVKHSLPMVTDAARLYRIHLALEERHGGDGPRVLRLDEECQGDAAAYLARTMIEEVQNEVENGNYYLSEAEGVYRMTWKGAFLMTWKQLPPFINVRMWQRMSKARRVLAEVEAESNSV
jgi:hypothetical protein